MTASSEAEPRTREIRRLYIANRGEIAGRIARTAHALGIEAIAAATSGSGAVDLLDADAVIDDARRVGADALHPGYGFLAEQATFAEAVVADGIRWVGPPASAIRAMGDKASARRLAASLGVSTLPGYDEPDQSDAALIAAARQLGAPLIVKPAAGGGGKGMRVVRSLDGLSDALGGARREARAAFGDDRLILERFVEGPRHVEIQVLFDEHGNGVHLGERDCSLQRRHQKILEESPSPAVDPDLREQLGAAALRLAAAVGYVSAGTVEFLLDDRDGFSFLEMNTRLQVEHPVTELVTGRDLVADQLRIAEGRLLALRQGEVALHGHAVEVRLYAEDAEDGFLPATGRIEALAWPDGPGIRVDSGIAPSDVVGGDFDPLLAKIVAAGATRDEALDRLAAALDETLLLGLTTNLRFLRWMARHPVLRQGEVRIDTLDRIWPPDDWSAKSVVPEAAWHLAAARLSGGGSTDDPWRGGWRLNAPAVVRIASDGDARRIDVSVSAADPSQRFVEAGGQVFVDVGGRSVGFALVPTPDLATAHRSAVGLGRGTSDVRAPMPGSVVAVHVAVGQDVDVADPLVTLEAMKMEHVVTATVKARVDELLIEAGDQVAKGQALAVLSNAAPDAGAQPE